MTRIEIRPKHSSEKALIDEISQQLGIRLSALEKVSCYTVSAPLSDAESDLLADAVLRDPVTEEVIAAHSLPEGFDWSIEVAYREGVTDNVGRTAQTAMEDALGRSLGDGQRVASSTRYLLAGKLSGSTARSIAKHWLANPLIHAVHVAAAEKELFENIRLPEDDHELRQLSRRRTLALSIKELRCIRNYFMREDLLEQRKSLGLSDCPSDVELEALAQTWSEHCKHKIFNGKIHYQEGEHVEQIDSLFQTYIKGATEKIAEKVDWLISVFTDNAGVIRFDDTHALVFKVETHNSPSALDPFGGALTGILGANRDTMGTGIGARLLANTDVFCFAAPNTEKTIPKGVLHPRRVLNGVRRGVEEGGNKCGVPTVNGCLVFDDRYLGKPLVYCGSAGIMPREVQGRPSELKEIRPGDRIVVVGGRTGKDGIHGATFSSEELHEESPQSAVQIGDPFTQKKVHDFLLEARDAGYFRTLTDNGAGGFSSSVGELAQIPGGARLDLERAPLKYPGLKAWEILVSESQERMTLAVPPERVEALETLAAHHEVELAVLGDFTDSGAFHVCYGEATVAYLPLDFLHDGVPQLELSGEWTAPQAQARRDDGIDPGAALLGLLQRPNICSKEAIIRQYDHEVQGGTVIKPLCGSQADGPSDAAVIWPIEAREKESYQGVVLANGLCPRYSDADAFVMAQCAVDEAIRNAICVGADPEHLALLDNFCWPDPVGDTYKTAQLVRACKGLYEACLAFSTPLISGKDSMKNDAILGGMKISVPPTLLISAIASIPDIRLAVTSDAKRVGDEVFVLGLSTEALRCSEYACLLNSPQFGELASVDLDTAPELYRRLHTAILKGWLASCHDCSDGGLAVALAETAMGGALGLSIDPYAIPTADGVSTESILFGESPSRLVLTAKPEHSEALLQHFEGLPFAKIGQVTQDPVLAIDDVLRLELSEMKLAWQTGLNGRTSS